MIFTEKEIELMKSIGLNCNFDNPSDDDWLDIEEQVGDALVLKYLDEKYEPTPEGWICEGIIDKIPT